MYHHTIDYIATCATTWFHSTEGLDQVHEYFLVVFRVSCGRDLASASMPQTRCAYLNNQPLFYSAKTATAHQYVSTADTLVCVVDRKPVQTGQKCKSRTLFASPSMQKERFAATNLLYIRSTRKRPRFNLVKNNQKEHTAKRCIMFDTQQQQQRCSAVPHL